MVVVENVTVIVSTHIFGRRYQEVRGQHVRIAIANSIGLRNKKLRETPKRGSGKGSAAANVLKEFARLQIGMQFVVNREDGRDNHLRDRFAVIKVVAQMFARRCDALVHRYIEPNSDRIRRQCIQE